ncbi:MAG: hypothetical protein KBG28_30130 [Kofleriaceae bacterium]|nr:hypothetical protein [Kofleriaceae bacterium]MBP9208266.1 hypothetical protein [Kofleriaceae bacterium]
MTTRVLALALAAIAGLSWPGAVARAQPGPAPTPTASADAIDVRIADGRRLFDQQAYGQAITALAAISRDVRATRSQRLRALELVALAHFIRRDQAAARSTFERILDIDPGYELRDRSGSPALRGFFAGVKRELVPGYDPAAGVELEHAAPRGASAGQRLQLEVRVVRAGDRVARMLVLARRRGELLYRETVAQAPGVARPGQGWRASVPLVASARGYVLEYVVEARAVGGEVLGRIGSPDAPLELPVGPGDPVAAAPWYGRWYVVAAAGVVLAGAAGIGYALSRADDEPGSLPPGTVTLRLSF